MVARQPDLEFSDRSDENGFINFFRSLPPLPDATVIRIFSRGGYYSVHGQDAIYVAQNVYRTLTVLKYFGNPDPERGLASCTFTEAVFRSFLRDALFNLGLKIEIYSSAGKNNWQCNKRASPGNIQDVEDLLSSSGDSSPVVIAVRVASKAEQKIVGVCFADASARELGVSEFADNELFSNLESLVIQLGVKEILLQQDEAMKDYDLKKVRGIADRCGIVVTDRRASDFNARDIEQDLSRLLEDELSMSMLPQTSLKVAMSAAACLLNYLSLMSDSTNFGQYKLYQHDLSQYMKLDSAAVRALNLMPGPRDGAKNMSLYGLLNNCKSAAGSRLLAQWLKQPLMDLSEIEKRHNLVNTLVNDIQMRQALQEEHLRAIPDFHKIAKKFQRGSAGLEEVVRVYQTVIRLPDMLSTLKNVEDETKAGLIEETYISPISEHNEGLQKLVELVETTIDLDALQAHKFIIKPEFDDSLKTTNEKIVELEEKVNQMHLDAADDLGLEVEKKLKLEKHQVYNWVFRVTRNVSFFFSFECFLSVQWLII